MIDMFTPWIKLQEDMLAFQRSQIDAATRAASAGQDMLSAQKAAQSAAQANMKAWESWMGLWGGRR